jgi:hypothetical protein
MREIKFRQWNSAYKRMEYGAGAHKPSGWTGFSNVSWERYPIMQYTGLKDKNGVEIYEGDIIEFDYLKYKLRGDVRWDQRRALFYTCGYGGSGVSTHGNIIGNIYENPELLDNSV